MSALDRGHEAERRMLGLLADAGLPAPDEVEHVPSAVRFIWEDSKVVVVVELDEDETEREEGVDR